MTEDDTFTRLRGLTPVQAREMYDYLFPIAMDSPTTITIGDVDDFIDERLRPYGWSLKMLYEQGK